MRDLRGQKGAAAVEFAIIAPLLFMIVFAILGFGIAFMQLQTIRGAVREGARISAVGATVAQVQQKVADTSTGIVLAGQRGIDRDHSVGTGHGDSVPRSRHQRRHDRVVRYGPAERWLGHRRDDPSVADHPSGTGRLRSVQV